MDDYFDDLESDESGLEFVISASTAEITVYSQTAQKTLRRAESLAAQTHGGMMTSEHLLLALASEPDAVAARILTSCGFDSVYLETSIGFVQGDRSSGEPGNAPSHSPRVDRILSFASNEATKRKCERIETLHLLAGLLREGRGITALILESPGVGHERLGAALSRAIRNGVTDPS